MNDWDSLLPTLQLTINSTHNSSINETPFYALFGYDSPSTTFSAQRVNYQEDDISYHLKKVAEIRKHCKTELLNAQAKYTDSANINRTSKEISIGQRVFAKLSKQLPKGKLDYPIDGPFTVVGTKGNAFVLKNQSSDKEFLVHPDYIVVGRGTKVDLNVSSKEKIEPEIKKNPKGNYNLRPRS